MQSTFFEYCGVHVNRDDPSVLIVHRTRPSVALVGLVLFPLPVLGMAIVRARLSAPNAIFFSLVLVAIAAYCVESYRAIRPRTWTFDESKREVRIDAELTYPFERLIRVELNQESVRKGREPYTRFVLTLCWMAGPERAFASRQGHTVSALALQIAEYAGVPLICTLNGVELQRFEAGFSGAGVDPMRRY